MRLANTEKLDGSGTVKATMLEAHLDWAEQQVEGAAEKLRQRVDGEARGLLSGSLLATAWIPLRDLVAVDRAIAELVGGSLLEVCRSMGRHSAEVNLGGVYKIFVKDEPHRFFRRMTVLHERFQSFGSPVYEELGDRAGRLRLEGCEEYSPVYCASALGYYETALRMMKVPGPIAVAETSCQCAGDPVCQYELSW